MFQKVFGWVYPGASDIFNHRKEIFSFDIIYQIHNNQITMEFLLQIKEYIKNNLTSSEEEDIYIAKVDNLIEAFNTEPKQIAPRSLKYDHLIFYFSEYKID